STVVKSPATVQGSTTTNNPRNPSPTPTPTTSTHLSQQVSTSARSRASTATPGATSSVTQQKTISPASLGNSPTTTAASPIPSNVSSPSAISGSLGSAVTSCPSVKDQGNQTLDQLTSTTASTTVPTSSLPPGLKDYGVSSPTSVSKQPHSSHSSPAQGLASSTRTGSTNTFVTPSDGSVSPTTTGLQAGSTSKVLEATTTPTLEADKRSHDTGSVSTKPASASQSPSTAQPSATAPRNQTASSSPGHQHPNASFPNQIICKEQGQIKGITVYLKEAKTCDEWKTTSVNISFFESFCSTGQFTFNTSRETCTVMLTSQEPRSREWTMQAILHFTLDSEKLLEKLQQKKDKLEEVSRSLGTAQVPHGCPPSYHKMEREMIINDEFSTPLIITIVTLAGSLLLIAAIYGCCHQRFSQKKDQRLTEELQTMENGYHDNPTLEVMETSSEMQEKKVNLNGELGDSWIVPLDTLMKEDLEEEEDTHL
ncbi:Podocalyxin, partial [Pelecanus crispus]